MRGVRADIDLTALRHNLQQVRTMVGNRKILVMIKSNGYGHGAVKVAKALSSVDGFGVASVDEGVVLRQAGILQPIVVMSQFCHVHEVPYLSEFNLSVVLHHLHQLELLEQHILPQPLNVWLKLDSGMHRLGFLPQQLASIWKRLHAMPAIKKPVGLMTHLANANERDDTTTLAQLQEFKQMTQNLSGERCISNSAAILHYGDIQQDWVRPGIMLYGVAPFPESQGADFNLRPVMTLRSELAAIKSLEKGDRIGYGGIWACPESMSIGVLTAGYGDGYPWHITAGTPVLINGVLCPIIGRVSMDLITVDLRACPQAQVGDSVILWGPGLPVEQIARCANTSAYELLCRIRGI